MTKTLALLTIHGMGDTEREYYTDVYDALRSTVGASVWDKIIFKDLYYQDILQGQQESVFNWMREHIDWMKLRKFLLFGFSDAASLEYKKDSPTSPYFLTQQMIMGAMDQIFMNAGKKDIPVVILAQSLGCQVMSSYIWDAQQQSKASVGIWSVPGNDGVAGGSKQDKFRRMKTLKCFYTTGCNIPIFVSGHKTIEAIPKPNTSFKWYNFFDADDVLGWPLKPLSPSYDKLVEDIPVNANTGFLSVITHSWNPFSHGQYWQDKTVINHLSNTLTALV